MCTEVLNVSVEWCKFWLEVEWYMQIVVSCVCQDLECECEMLRAFFWTEWDMQLTIARVFEDHDFACEMVRAVVVDGTGPESHCCVCV